MRLIVVVFFGPRRVDNFKLLEELNHELDEIIKNKFSIVLMRDFNIDL